MPPSIFTFAGLAQAVTAPAAAARAATEVVPAALVLRRG